MAASLHRLHPGREEFALSRFRHLQDLELRGRQVYLDGITHEGAQPVWDLTTMPASPKSIDRLGYGRREVGTARCRGTVRLGRQRDEQRRCLHAARVIG
jgi:hypothetical protein